MLRVAVYLHPSRVGPGETGVGKHIKAMTGELASRPGVAARVLAPAGDWRGLRVRDPAHPLLTLPADRYWAPRAVVEKVWSVAGFPPAEWWAGPADWVYCPAEAYVPTRVARLAVTVHCMNWFEPALPWYAASRGERNRWRVRLWRAYRRPDVLVLTVSEFLKGRLVELFGIRPERIAVVGNGVEAAYYAAADAAPGPAPERPYLLVVGGLTRRKGGDRVLRVADLLRDRGAATQVWVAGRSEPEFEAAAAAHPAVRLLGYRGVETGLPELMRDSVAVLFPSRYETFGIPAAEGMAAGAPVIVTGEAALPEVVGDGGIVVPAGDPAAIAEEADRLLGDGGYRASWVARGRVRSAAHTWAACGDRLVAALTGGKSDGTAARSRGSEAG